MAARYARRIVDVPRPFEGRLVRLRPYEPTDPSRLNPAFIEPDVLDGVGLPMPQSVDGFRRFLEQSHGRTDQLVLAIERLSDGEPIGGIGLMEVNAAARTAVLGVWIGRPWWDQGLGTDAVRTLCRYAFRFMNLQRIELNVFATNPRAVRAYEKVGFRTEGTRRRSTFVGGRHVDSYLMGLLAEELVDDDAQAGSV